MHCTKRIATATGLVAGLAAAAMAMAAAYVSPLIGGGGGTSYSRGCGTGAVLIGLQVRYTYWVDQMTPICRELGSNGALGNEFTLARIGGTGGNTVLELRCGSGKVVVGAVSRWASLIDSISLRCAVWDASTKKPGTTITSTATAGGSGGVTTTTLSCPANQVGKGFKGKAAAYVDSLSLVCNAWNQ